MKALLPLTLLALAPLGALAAVAVPPSDTVEKTDGPPSQPAILSSGFIYEKASFASCHAVTLVETPSGLVSAWFGGTAEGNPDVCIYIARHEGGLWTLPVKVATGETPGGPTHPCWNPVLIQPKAGHLMLFYKVGPSPQKWWGMLRTSADDGRTWSEGVKLPDGMLGPIKNKPVMLASGDMLCPTSTESVPGAKPAQPGEDARTLPKPSSDWRVHFERTSDLGKTWTRAEPAANTAGSEVNAIQPSILLLGGSKLLAIGRSRNGKLFETTSEDDGKTWSPLSLTTLPNPNSGTDAVTLKDGSHVLVYNHSPNSRNPMNVAVSKDGKAWEAALVIEDMKTKGKGEFSYPAVIQTSDGLVHIAYTWKRQRIRHVVVDPSLITPRAFVNGEWPK